jgi:hypothetical protein
MTPRALRSLLALLVLLAPARAQAPDVASARTRALAAITEAGIAADLAFVACADMGGRPTPSTEQRLCARFLQNRLQRLGWEPGCSDGYLHRYPLRQAALEGGACRAHVQAGEQTLDLVLADDYSIPPLAIASHDVQGGVVHVGAVPEQLDARSAAALRSRWAWFTAKGASLDDLDAGLRAAGAIGVLTTVDVLNTGGDPEARYVFEMFADLMRRGTVSRPTAQPMLPRVYLPRKTTARLLALAGAQAPQAGDVMPFAFAETRRAARDEIVFAENVVGLWRGSDPERARHAVIVSAHYDHLGVARDGRVHHGADDNGSGVVALLAVAEALAAHGPLPGSVLLLWTSGEEKGLWGSQAFAEDPRLPSGITASADINLDMVGRGEASRLSLTPFAETHPAYGPLAELAARCAREEGFTELQSADPYFHRSDNYSFSERGIPAVSLFDDMTDDYHQPTDTADKVDADKVRRVARMVFRMLCEG